MRMLRMKVTGRGAVYHCISRIVGGQGLLGDGEKDKFCRLMRQQAAFSGVEIITHCVMSNHTHLLVRVPGAITATDADLVERAAQYYGKDSFYVETLQKELEKLGQLPEELRKGLLRRMGDVSVFNKELKQRFSKWYNKLHERHGTLWSERFKSVLVEDVPSAIQAVAAYIDLNPVRAGLEEDPKDYRWSGYGEAVAGQALAQQGLASFHESGEWAQVGPEYRKVLFVTAGRSGNSGKVALDAETIRRELARGGQLSLAEVFMLRVRYFSDGVVIGSRSFVEEMFQEFRDRFGARRKSGARPLRGLSALSHLATLRDLRRNAVG